MLKQEDIDKIKKDFNDLPYDIRCKAVCSDLMSQINKMNIQKRRLKQNYNRELKYINEYINNLRLEIESIIRQKYND